MPEKILLIVFIILFIFLLKIDSNQKAIHVNYHKNAQSKKTNRINFDEFIFSLILINDTVCNFLTIYFYENLNGYLFFRIQFLIIRKKKIK